jgi:hypothetical protein
MIHIPILAVNTDKEIWGEDAAEFKCVSMIDFDISNSHKIRPERWKHIPKGANDIPGVWANLLTFFAGQSFCNWIISF